MLRTLFALVSGFFAFGIVVTIVEAIDAFVVYPPPPGLDLRDPAQVNAFIAGMPASALALVVLGWCLGAFIGGGLAARLAERYRITCASAIGAIAVVGVIVNAQTIQHPMWVVAAGVALPIPLAIGAALLVRRVWPAPGR